MLYLISGTPGASKTLNCIKMVKERAEKENRPVFYWNIRNLSLALGWQEMDEQTAKTWYDLPEGSIIVFDESYDLFPAWGQKKEPEEHVKRIATHRHKGFDIYMVFQDPSVQMSGFMKGLVEAHIHFERVLGSKIVRRFTWNTYQGSLRSSQARKQAMIETKPLDKSIFNLYDSATIHTDKKRLPFKYILLFASLPLGAIFVAFMFYRASGIVEIGNHAEPEMKVYEEPKKDTTISDLGQQRGAEFMGKTEETILSKRDLSRYQERLQGMPWTAPIYDDVRPVVSAPRPAACIKSDKGCTCYTQQATPLHGVSQAFCESHVENGYFDDTVPDVRSHHVQNLPEPSKPSQTTNKPVTRSEAVYSF